MVNENKNYHWLDSYKEGFKKSFEKINLHTKKSEYWRFASPSIWYDDFSTTRKYQEKSKLTQLSKFELLNKNIIKFKDGIIDIGYLNKFIQKNKNIGISCFNDVVLDNNHWSVLKYGKAQYNAEKSYERPLATYNGFNATDGIFIKFKKGITINLHIIYEGNKEKSSIIRNLFDFEEGVKIKIFEHFYGNSKYNVVSEFFSDKNSNFEHVRVFDENMGNTVIYHLFGNCQKLSNVKTINFSFSDNPVRNEINLYLEGSDCIATVACLGFEKKQTSICDNTVLISHKNESCKSRQIIKNVLKNQAKAIFQGKIFVSSDAQKTDGYQMSNGLILDDNCEFLVKPELEIYADDVACSHGSISGTLNTEHLFYLQSRGIPLHEAQKKLIQAFFSEILDEVSDINSVDYINDQITKILTD